MEAPRCKMHVKTGRELIWSHQFWGTKENRFSCSVATPSFDSNIICVRYLLLCYKLPLKQSILKTNICYLFISVGQASGWSLCGSFALGFVMRLQAQWQLGPQICGGLHGGRSAPSSVGHLLADLWLSVAADRRHQFLASYSASSHHDRGFPQNSNKGERNRKRVWARRKSHTFCNLILKVAHCHFCYILFLKSELTQGEEIAQRHEYEEAEISRDHFSSCL